MKSLFRIIIGSIIVIAITFHFTVLALFIGPVPKVLALTSDYNVDYIYISNIPEYVLDIFPLVDKNIEFTTIPQPRERLFSFANPFIYKILELRNNKFLDISERYELYLNTFSFGGEIVGIEAASNYYFNKSISDLSYKEVLTLHNLYSIFK